MFLKLLRAPSYLDFIKVASTIQLLNTGITESVSLSASFFFRFQGRYSSSDIPYGLKEFHGIPRDFRGVAGSFMEFQECSSEFQRRSREFKELSWSALQGVSGMFQTFSRGGIPGYFRVVPGIFKGVPGDLKGFAGNFRGVLGIFKWFQRRLQRFSRGSRCIQELSRCFMDSFKRFQKV